MMAVVYISKIYPLPIKSIFHCLFQLTSTGTSRHRPPNIGLLTLRSNSLPSSTSSRWTSSKTGHFLVTLHAHSRFTEISSRSSFRKWTYCFQYSTPPICTNNFPNKVQITKVTAGGCWTVLADWNHLVFTVHFLSPKLHRSISSILTVYQISQPATWTFSSFSSYCQLSWQIVCSPAVLNEIPAPISLLLFTI